MKNFLLFLLAIPITLFIILFAIEMIEGAKLQHLEQSACRQAATTKVEYWKC